MDVDCCLHTLGPKRSPAKLNVPELLLQLLTVRKLLSHVDDFPEGGRFSDWPDLGCTLAKANQLACVVKVQNPLGALTKGEDPIEEGREKFQETPFSPLSWPTASECR